MNDDLLDILTSLLQKKEEYNPELGKIEALGQPMPFRNTPESTEAIARGEWLRDPNRVIPNENTGAGGWFPRYTDTPRRGSEGYGSELERKRGYAMQSLSQYDKLMNRQDAAVEGNNALATQRFNELGVNSPGQRESILKMMMEHMRMRGMADRLAPGPRIRM